MKISKDIQKKMHKIASISQESARLMRDVEAYLISKGFDGDMLRRGNGRSLEELEYGNDITDEFAADAENDFKNDIWN